MILPDKCECGGDVYVILVDEIDKYGCKKRIVSHGTCERCFKNVVLPQDTEEDFRDQLRQLEMQRKFKGES